MSFCAGRKPKTLTPTNGVTKEKGDGRLLFFFFFLVAKPLQQSSKTSFLDNREISRSDVVLPPLFVSETSKIVMLTWFGYQGKTVQTMFLRLNGCGVNCLLGEMHLGQTRGAKYGIRKNLTPTNSKVPSTIS